MTWKTLVASVSVRAIGPAMSASVFSGITPARLVRPIVDRIPASAWCDDGPRMELPVSLPSPTRPKLAATPAAVPPLDPAVERSSAYGFFVWPGRMDPTVSYGVNAHSAMFVLARTMAPASLTRFTRNASLLDTKPSSASDPFALCSPTVSKLSFTSIGTQWSGPTGPEAAKRASSAAASSAGARVDHDDCVQRGTLLVVRLDALQVGVHERATCETPVAHGRVHIRNRGFDDRERRRLRRGTRGCNDREQKDEDERSHTT